MSWLIVIASLLGLAIIVFILHSYRQFKSNAKFKLKTEKEKLLQEEKIHNEELHHKEIQLSAMRNFILFVDGVEGNFVSRLHSTFPDLSDDDITLMMLLRLKMPTKALALIYGISEKSIKQKLFVYKAKVGRRLCVRSLKPFKVSNIAEIDLFSRGINING